MVISIFTTLTRPEQRGDAWKPALDCYSDLADELVMVRGEGPNAKPLDYDSKNKDITHALTVWPTEFNWPQIGEAFQYGYEVASGDVVLHADLDFIFHENDFDNIRKAAQKMLDDKLPAMSMWKYQMILPDRYNLKSRLVIMVNKRDYADRIKFDSGGDLCQVSLDRKYLSSNDVPEARVPFYNYEKLLKTKKQIMDDVGRMERAYKRHFGKTQYGSDGTDKDAYNKWIEAQKGKLAKPQKHIKLEEHPKYMQETIKNLKPEQFGYSMFGVHENDYVKKT